MDKLLGCAQMVANMLLRDEKPARAEAAEELKTVAATAQAELTELRAFKAACEGQDEVAEVYGQCVSGFTDVIDLTREKLNRGEKLYRHPDPGAARLRLRVKGLEAFAEFSEANCDELMEKLAKLTEQRDLAVEALESCVDYIRGPTAWTAKEEDELVEKAIAAIQSSKVKE